LNLLRFAIFKSQNFYCQNAPLFPATTNRRNTQHVPIKFLEKIGRSTCVFTTSFADDQKACKEKGLERRFRPSIVGLGAKKRKPLVEENEVDFCGSIICVG
jgi:hypothetical protein